MWPLLLLGLAGGLGAEQLDLTAAPQQTRHFGLNSTHTFEVTLPSRQVELLLMFNSSLTPRSPGLDVQGSVCEQGTARPLFQGLKGGPPRPPLTAQARSASSSPAPTCPACSRAPSAPQRPSPTSCPSKCSLGGRRPGSS